MTHTAKVYLRSDLHILKKHVEIYCVTWSLQLNQATEREFLAQIGRLVV